MATTIRRDALNYTSLNLTADPATSAGIPLRLAAGACVLVESVSGAGSVTFYCKEDRDSTDSFRLVDATGSPIVQNIQAGVAFPIPTETFAATFVTLVCNSGTAVIRYSAKG